MRLFSTERLLCYKAPGEDKSLYMTRTCLFRWPLFESQTDGVPLSARWEVRLHYFHRSDTARVRHNHPCNYWTLPLWRGYIDDTAWEQSRLKPLHLYARGANHFHRVQLLDEKPALTLVLLGPRWQDWGFFTETGFVPWRTYTASAGESE